VRQIFCSVLLVGLASLTFSLLASAQTNVYGGYGVGAAAAESGRAFGRWFGDETATRTRADLTRCCPTVSIESCAVADTGHLPDRYSLVISQLGLVGGRSLSIFRYRRETLFRDPAFAGVDRERQPYFPCRASRVLLVHEISDEQYRVIWEGWQDELSFRLADVVLHRGDAGHILAFTYCVDGTGGCWQELFIKTTAEPWRPLEKDGSWDSVYAGLPDGYSLHKSPAIDLEAMTWDRAMATVNDPNCCPSGAIKMKLAIRNSRLSILSYDYIRHPFDED